MVSAVIVLTSAAEVVIAQALFRLVSLLLTILMLPTPIRFLFGTKVPMHQLAHYSLLLSPSFYPSNELVV
jgi:hypothetical protein